MMTEAMIALKERINEKRAEMIKLGNWERERAFEIQHLIRRQAILADEIMMLEYDLAQEKIKQPSIKPPTMAMIAYAEKLLRGMGL